METIEAPASEKIDLSEYGLEAPRVIRNAAPAFLYEEAIRNDRTASIASNGALVILSGEKTGRSPGDKRTVEHEESRDNIWWGSVNVPLDDHTFMINRERALDYLNTCDTIYVVDGFAGWDSEHRIKVRVICSRAYHALFMHNMLIRPDEDDLAGFGDPDYTIINAGVFPANRHTTHMTSKTSVDLNFERRELVILGTEYAGEMKKGVFTIMNYIMPREGVLSMHCSANAGEDGDVTLFFGLSGTGKTTLSADPRRRLIGDDEHCWTDDGIFNIEGGCYAKAINLSRKGEPEIYAAIRFGAVLENVICDPKSRDVDYTDTSITQNTRAAYPIEFIPNAQIPCVGGHPKNIVFLAYDAFGVLPPVSRLTPSQAMYHFISGYTAKVAGTEMGVDEPQATFSACFGAAFLVWHPSKYAEMLAEQIQKHDTHVWLVNTGLTGGPHGTGQRISLKHTRAVIDAIHSGALEQAETTEDAVFGFAIPTECPGVPSEILLPRNTWDDRAAYDNAQRHLAKLFADNFEKYREGASSEIAEAGPRL
jgi:phosphoenolpyruvate carboxykinase (ATP)